MEEKLTYGEALWYLRRYALQVVRLLNAIDGTITISVTGACFDSATVDARVEVNYLNMKEEEE